MMKNFIMGLSIILAVSIVMPAAVFSQDYYSGKIQGASYVFNKTVQPTSSSDPKVILERDFVLQEAGGGVYFLVNVPRSMKIKAVNKDVRVYGEKDGNGKIFVHHIDYKIGDKFVALCDWEEKMKDLNKGN